LNKALDLDESEITATDQSLGAVSGADSLVGKDPKGIAAATVYLTGEDYTQAAVAEAVCLNRNNPTSSESTPRTTEV